jgi:hypothetical protein
VDRRERTKLMKCTKIADPTAIALEGCATVRESVILKNCSIESAVAGIYTELAKEKKSKENLIRMADMKQRSGKTWTG